MSSDNETVSIFEIFFAAKRAPWFFTLTFIVCMAMVAAVYLALPRQYYSEGKYYVQVGRSSVGVDPTTTSGTISIQDSRETEVRSVVELLRSRELAERVVDIVGADRILEPNSVIERILDSLPRPSLSSGTAAFDDEEMSDERYAYLRKREKAANSLMSRLDLDHPKTTTVISVAIKAQSPSLAQKIVNTYLSEYQKKHIEINSGNAAEFFETEFVKQSDALKSHERLQQQFRDQYKTLSIEGARALQQRELDQLKLDRIETIVQLSQQTEKATQLAHQLTEIPELIEGVDTQVSSVASDKAHEALFHLQIEESEAAARYNEDNPKLQMIRDQVRKAQKEMQSIPETFNQVERNISAANQELLVLLTDARASASALTKRLTQTENLIAAAEEQAKILNEADIRGNELDRDVQIGRQSLMKIADKRAETKTIGALDKERITNVSVAQAASLEFSKAFPSGKAFAVLGTVLSFFVSLALTFFKEANMVVGRPVSSRASISTPILQPSEVPRGSLARVHSTP